MDWITGIQRALDYVEEHITEPIDYEEAARRACSSSFHFQRVFSVLCGFTLGEYIRLRRLRRGPDVRANGLKMVIYDQVLSERLLQFNDVCRCQLVIADDVGFAKALNRVLFCNINGVGVADVVEIVHEWLPLYMLTCAHIEQRLMPNPQRFEGLEEEDITWYSNRYSAIFECR